MRRRAWKAARVTRADEWSTGRREAGGEGGAEDCKADEQKKLSDGGWRRADAERGDTVGSRALQRDYPLAGTLITVSLIHTSV